MIPRADAAVVVGALAVASLLLAPAVAQARAPRWFFGVAPQSALTDRDFSRMARAKVGTLRFGLHWAGVEPSRGTFDWSGPDSYVRRAAENHIRLLPYLSGTPEWAARLDGRACAGDGCAAYAPEGRKALAAWSEFVAAAVARYGPGGGFWVENPTVPRSPVRAWQIWNEQNSPTFYEPRPNVNAFAKLLAVSHAAIARQDPGAEVILGGMFGSPLGGLRPGLSAPDYLAKLYRKGAAKDFDAVAPHPYGSTFKRVLSQIKLLRDEMRKARDASSELWITELGWASGGPPSPLNKGEKGQAAELGRAFKFFAKRRKRLNIGNVDWYSWRDSSASAAALCEWCPESGLLEEDFTTKPSLDAFTTFTGGK